ncbi:hypothetical protein ACH5RR_024435 [Cinchona calisaya]|uniref:Early flowering 3 n=1 Tax=Cinchona calisaya TaxID=153742 RepID=A0ABD2YXR5_9GENT
MKAGKDEKQMDPMFPKLHINDADRGGGPRAPPRNKMAVCEQLNVSSQRLSSGSMSMRPLPSCNSSNLVHCQKNGGLSSFCSSPESSHKAERVHSNSSAGMNLSNMYPEFQILKTGDYQAFRGRRPLKMTAEFRLFQPYGFYNSMNSSAKKVGNEDDPRIPYFGQREELLNHGSVEHKMEKEKVISSSLSFSEQYQTSSERQEKEIRRNDVKSREHPRNQAEDNCKVSEMTDDNAKRLHPHPSTGKMVLADAAPSASVAIYRTCESGNRAVVAIHHSNRSSVVNDLSTLHDTCTEMRQQSRSFLVDTAIDENASRNPERHLRKRSFSEMESPSCSGSPTVENNRIPNRHELVNECPKSNDCASSRVGDVERNLAISDNSVGDSKSGLDISPDYVVEVIGPKFFWSVRRTIAHQQRIFGVQIFELHRLIKVQRLIAESPEMLFEDNVVFNKPSVNFSLEKKLQLEKLPEPPALFLKPKVDFPKPKPCLDYASEDAHRKLPIPTYDTEKGHVTPKSALKPYPGPLTSTSFALDARIGPWCFNTPPGNQWLVPVRSPSEGLIYKPYTGPYPPIAGYVAPFYGGCGTMSSTRNGDCVNTAYGFPASNHQDVGVNSRPVEFGRSCFQTYALPMMNTSNSSSAVEQMNPFATVRDINYVVPYRSPCDVTSQKSGIMTDCSRNMPISKGSDFQGSTNTTTTTHDDERKQGDVLSLFPTTPTAQMSQQAVKNHNTEQQIQVIKVVPHNPKSASESAARIFRSIQEERKQYA